MGCASSTELAPAPAKDAHENHKKSITAGTEKMAFSSHDQIDSITTTPTNTMENCSGPTPVAAGNFNIRYACLSKRGRDPDDASKPNQDSFSVDRLGKDNSDAFFGVYDGHGSHGEECSQLTQRRLPALVKYHLRHLDEDSTVNEFQDAMVKATMECNHELRRSKIPDSYSGTTSITLYFHPDDSGRITVCNVGDSRAVLGTTKPGKLQACPLSKDQTPYRSDEAARCMRAGARILSFGQIDPNSKDEDDIEDPPRVWAPNGNYPGTAFTRSIGDAVAESLGVIAEPEMLTLKLSEKEKLLVLASDGIFDVMSNQEVIDMCFAHREDPKQACRAVIEKSHQEWLLNEECVDEESASYDDMTLICIFVGDIPSAVTEETGNGEDVQLPKPTSQPRDHSKRRRQKTLRNLEEMKEDPPS